MSRRTRARSGRSNAYSESRHSNWGGYDPQANEANKLFGRRPEARYALADGQSIELHSLPVHKDFVRPFDLADVTAALDRLPRWMLDGLERIALLGGTARQAKSALSAGWCYGWYGDREICLFAFPKRRMEWWSASLDPPAVLADYRRAGVAISHERGEWVYRFGEESIRRFYLRDVLVHEVGHHVDRFHPDRSERRSERFAEWFTRRHSFGN